MEEKLYLEFVEAATAHGAYTDSGDARRTNRAHDRIMKTLAKIKQFPDRGERFLRSLLDHDNDSVKGWAATYLLPLNQETATPVLEKLMSAGGLESLSAKMVLKLWRAGTLELVNWP